MEMGDGRGGFVPCQEQVEITYLERENPSAKVTPNLSTTGAAS